MPKTILQLMNVDGMTRENVASHLQKYRQQLRRMEPWGSEPQVGLLQLHTLRLTWNADLHAIPGSTRDRNSPSAHTHYVRLRSAACVSQALAVCRHHRARACRCRWMQRQQEVPSRQGC